MTQVELVYHRDKTFLMLICFIYKTQIQNFIYRNQASSQTKCYILMFKCVVLFSIDSHILN